MRGGAGKRLLPCCSSAPPTGFLALLAAQEFPVCKQQLLISPRSAHFTLQTRSKSLSDIPLACPARKPPGGTAADEGSPDVGTAAQWEGANGGRRLAAARDSEAQWQDVSPVHSIHTTMCCLCCLRGFFSCSASGMSNSF